MPGVTQLKISWRTRRVEGISAPVIRIGLERTGCVKGVFSQCTCRSILSIKHIVRLKKHLPAAREPGSCTQIEHRVTRYFAGAKKSARAAKQIGRVTGLVCVVLVATGILP